MANKKAAREAKLLSKVTAKVDKFSADKVITGKEARKLSSKFGGAAVSNVLAQKSLGDPTLQLGKKVGKYTGLKIMGEGEGRYATFKPRPTLYANSKDAMMRAIGELMPNNSMQGTLYGNNWTQTGSGRYRYGGPITKPSTTPTVPGGNQTDTIPGGDQTEVLTEDPGLSEEPTIQEPVMGPQRMGPEPPRDPIYFGSNNFSWRSPNRRGKKRGIKSTSSPTTARRTSPTFANLGI